MLVGDFEGHFRDFVRGFGGTVLPESDAESADFLFPQDNIIGELKTLQEDASSEYGRKLQSLADGWIRRGLLIAFGRVQISLRKVHPICQREWLHILQPPIERIIRKANRQIRVTKQSLNLPSATHILGVIYFSYRVPSREEGMPFWFAGDTDPKGDVQMQALQERLRCGWFSYMGEKLGLPVTTFVVKPTS